MAKPSQRRQVSKRVRAKLGKWIGDLKSRIAGLGHWLPEPQLAPVFNRVPRARRQGR